MSATRLLLKSTGRRRSFRWITSSRPLSVIPDASSSSSDARRYHYYQHLSLQTPPRRYFHASLAKIAQDHQNAPRIFIDPYNDGNDNDILEVLQDVPPGCLTAWDIQRAESALEEYASSREFETAKSIFMRLIREQEYYQNEELNETDNQQHYQIRPFLLNRVLDCWRRGWRNGKLDIEPTEIIAWLHELQHTVMPDSRGLTLIIDGICLRGNKQEAPLLAQWLLDQRMEYIQELEDQGEYEEEGNEDSDSDDDETYDNLRPDTIMISNVIRAWAKSDRMEAPEMAEGLLQMMHDLYEKGWKNAGPNAQSYGVTMEAWYNSQRPEATERILNLLQDMKHSSLEQVKPDRVCYQYAINALIRLRTKSGMDQAHHLLQEMIDLFQAGNATAAPNAYLFSRVMAGMAQQGDVNGMDAILEQLQDLYATTGDPNLQPNDQCWKAYIIGKSKAGSTIEAQDVLDDLIERAIASGNKSRMPLRGYFIDTLVGWTKIKDQLMAAQQSHKVLRQMIDLGKNSEFRDWLPDGKTFDKVILAWSRSRDASAPDHIEVLLKEMETVNGLGYGKRIRPSVMGYTNWMLAWERSKRKDATIQIQNLFKDLRGGVHGLYPDKYTYGIVIKALGQDGQYEEAERLLQEMMQEYRNANGKAKPDAHLFHSLLLTASKRTDGKAIEKCEEYRNKMTELGLSPTVLSSAYLIDALSKSQELDKVSRAQAILEETLESSRNGPMPTPSPKDYHQFLRSISNSCIPGRNQQARGLLKETRNNRGKPKVPRDLMPRLPVKQQKQLK